MYINILIKLNHFITYLLSGEKDKFMQVKINLSL